MLFLNPLEEFEILEFLYINSPYLLFTNSNLYLILTIIILIIINKPKLNIKLINKRRIINEIIYSSILNIINNQIKDEKYIGIIYGLFNIILISNLLGMIPYGFTTTSHFILTLSIGIAILIAVTIIGFKKYK